MSLRFCLLLYHHFYFLTQRDSYTEMVMFAFLPERARVGASLASQCLSHLDAASFRCLRKDPDFFVFISFFHLHFFFLSWFLIFQLFPSNLVFADSILWAFSSVFIHPLFSVLFAEVEYFEVRNIIIPGPS